MSDYDPYWWQAEKAESLNRKSPKAESTGDTFLIVTEGTVSEPVYFKLLREELGLSAVEVLIVPGDHSDPRHVIRTADAKVNDLKKRVKKEMLSNDEVAQYDQVWAVIDTDVAVREGFWNDVQNLARGKDVKLAHTTPCIEFWFLLHLSDSAAPLADGSAAKSAMKALVKARFGTSYSTTQKEAEQSIALFFPHWPTAVARAGRIRQYQQDAHTLLPANPSTEVDQLVSALNNAAPIHLQKKP